MAVAAKERLQLQTIAINCAIEDANYAVANYKNLRILEKRRTELEAAWLGYQQALEYHQLTVTDKEAHTAAQQARHLQRNSIGEALEELEELIEAKQNKVEENCTENPSMEGVCSSLTKELLAEGKQDLMVHLVKQELPEVLIRSNGGLDPGEVVDFKDMVEVVAILGKEEEKQRMLMEVRDCGGLDPGEAVNKVVMEECSFKDKVEKCGFNDKVKQEMNVEVKQDAQVWKLLCDVFFNLKFEFLVAWLVLMLHTTMRLRFVNICKTAFNLESLLRLSDYG